MAAVGTWSFSQPAVDRLRSLITSGCHATDAVEEAMAGWLKMTQIKFHPSVEMENDPETGRHIVGRGGFPNSEGVLECDAAIMQGTAGKFGAVAALRGIGTPIRVARKVMDRSPHSLLVGDGAAIFAREQGFSIEPNDSMLSVHSTKAYEEYLENRQKASGHDTLGLIALDKMGNITVGVSTSGAPFKSPGRVGDSPIPGSGLYAEHMVGAAAATGDGDRIMCYCPSFQIVQLMKQGSSPNEACCAVLKDIRRRTFPEKCFELGLIALNMKGEVGAASTVEFPYVFWDMENDSVEIRVQLPPSNKNE
ncbi:N(4)-(Beta-N-acetylglucosaminyl)-L-asparaginase isoform X2 [Osmerus mordax]|uniref:N(4)-(Beta-N-acetylglucosaminyl)-L-asparaginase isoform X2 n=1 Tax=Osmerus mordax TaxID=8014 RepID=UPI00350F8DC4